MRKFLIILAWTAVLILAFHLRTEGLFRGLADEQIYHPDEPKQVTALWRYLNDEYEWHTGSVFYDGYPYGLNHVDEWLLRPCLAVWRGVVSHWSSSAPESHEVPAPLPLFYIARSLRVLYGMASILLACLVGRYLKLPRLALWYMVMLLALAPISISVTHFATGDIGTDLFTALMMLMLCYYSRAHKPAWLFLAGMCAGMSFACKYNGLLCGAAVGIYLLFQCVYSRNWKWFGVSAVNLVAGILTGIVLLTPVLLFDYEQTCKDIFANFMFIQNYGAGDWYNEMSGLQKAEYILTANVPKILGYIGWGVAIMALFGTVTAGFRVKDALKRKLDPVEVRAQTVLLAICICPFIALFISLAGKPEVHPFHFSYVQIPLTLAAVYGVSALCQQGKGPVAVGLMFLVAISTVLELGLESKQDNFFWGKQDSTFIENEMSWYVFSDEGRNVGPKEHLKEIFIEPESASVFRNRKSEIRVNGGQFWHDLYIAPVPSIPYPEQNDWVFGDGPVFPRNDRMFKVRRDTNVAKHVVVYGSLRDLTVGMRSGSWPVELKLVIGGVDKIIRLAPNSQDVVTIKPAKYRHIGKRGKLDKNVYLVPVDVSASVGDVYLTLLTGEADRCLFSIFGGHSDMKPSEVPAGITPDRIVQEVARTRYLEDGNMDPVVMDSGDEDTSKIVFPVQLGHEPVGFPLPCGAFTMELDVVVLSDAAEFSLCLDDFRRIDGFTQSTSQFTLSRGHHVVKYDFMKSYAPYQCCVVAACSEGRVRINSWNLVPATEKILKDLDLWRVQDRKPEWLRRFAGVPEITADAPRGEIVFGNSVRLNCFKFPSVVKNGQAPAVKCGMELIKYPFRNFGEYSVFVHLLNQDGRQLYATGFSLPHAVVAGDTGLPVPCDIIEGLPSGEYKIEIGIWNSRTGDRLRPEGTGLSRTEIRKKKVLIATTVVLD